ncbi:MAG: C_GCAxxG_C_C family protein [Lachnospiraceae bacterium]|nr:C_GCAxxG_C_C family protein [Lachnospiraceae bacterium]
MDKKEKAIALHDKKFNCCQSVACAFAAEAGVDEEVLFKAGEGFGLGMGGMECTCGALTGAILLAGFKNSDGNLDNPGTKADTYKLSKEMVTLFKEKTGAIICKDLKGIETGTVICSCPDCICKGVEVVQEVLGY